MQITNEQLKAIVPFISDEHLNIYVPLLNQSLDRNSITTNKRLACFIAQTAHESESFNCVKEIADGRAYEGRIDLGNTLPGDGVRFKGRGLIGCTGKDNYKACSLYLFNDERLLDEPDLLEIPENALGSAYWYWASRELNEICDKPENWFHQWNRRTYNKFGWLTVKINGGLNGYVSRLAFYERAKKVLNINEVLNV